MGQTLADDAQTEEDKFLIDSKVGHVTTKLRHGNLRRNPSQSSFFNVSVLVSNFFPFDLKIKLNITGNYSLHIVFISLLTHLERPVRLFDSFIPM